MPLYALDEDPSHFPPPAHALTEPNGLLAIGGDLSPERLKNAYANGIFPWYSPDQPILWWSPDPRTVLHPEHLRISRSLRKTLSRGHFELRCDNDFSATLDGCAAPRPGADGTWIVPAMREAYRELHRQGLAHSVETWLDGTLVGGLYGVQLGRVFFGESMFSRVSDASKAALAHLCQRQPFGPIGLIDCQFSTAHLLRLGAVEIRRATFIEMLHTLIHAPQADGPG